MIKIDANKHPFLKNILVLASGSVIAAIINVIAAPFITRIYTPEIIGIYSYLLSFAQLFWPVMNARYDMSIVTEENNEYIFPLIKVSLIISLFLGIIVSIGYGIYIYHSKEYSEYFYTSIFLFVILLSFGIINVLTAYNNRLREYKTLSLFQVIRSAFQNIIPVIWGYINPNVLGLLLPYTFGQILGVNYQFDPLKKHAQEIIKVKWKSLYKVAKIHYRQPLLSSPALFVNTFSYTSITIFVELLFDMSIVGFYSISTRLLGLPLNLVSGNVLRVFFEEASREFYQTGDYFKAFTKTVKFLIFIAIPMTVTLMIIPSKFYGLFFGEEWIIAGQYIQILAPMFGIRFIVSPLTAGFQISKKQKSELFFQILLLITSVLPFIITKVFLLPVTSFLMLITISKSIVYVFFFFILLKFSRNLRTK